jgi:hypothetical protein
VIASLLANGERIYLAIWDHTFSGVPRDWAREMWFVSPDYGGTPAPLPGKWKMRDKSLTGIGSVDPAVWGAND